MIPIPSIVQIESSSAQYSGDVDIGHYASNKGSITVADVENFNIIKNAFVPTPQFKFPYSVHCKNQRDMKCFLSTKHFNSFYPGLHISIFNSLGGLFCRLCVLFAKCGGIHKSTPQNKFVVSPLQKYSKLLGKDGD